MTVPGTLDLFAGPGGWSTGLRLLGLEDLGIEIDPTACATRTAAGHATVCADVSALDPADFAGVTGLIASSPCQTFSTAGKRAGLADMVVCHRALNDLAAGRDSRAALVEQCRDRRSLLVVEPLRYALALSPQWVAVENVPATAPLLEHTAAILREHGYRAWSGEVNAADYGLAQSRRRALLLAHSDRLPALPAPTHRGGAVQPDLFGSELRPWVTMADALGWPRGLQIRTRGMRRAGTGGNLFSADRPAWTLTEKARSWTVGSLDALAHTWRQLTAQEAAVLQGFPPDYPFQGRRSTVFRQIGDAVPPLLAAAVLDALCGTEVTR
ncbi:DNA cytosine methyltransferase [Planomonospora alba]|uniref:DNA (cytosine-5-)-methyltransferase n=1 Tax=Planomonospora alba TaxID=161354 RepID=A0ABP6NCE3_9ACTN